MANFRTVFKRYLSILPAMLLLLAARGQSQTRTASHEIGKRILSPFDYAGVTLEDGPLKSQFDEIRFDYLRIPPDALLKGFRQRAGLPAPGIDLGGWYSSDVFHVFGQILSGLARMYAATGDPACLKRAEYLRSEWSKCISPDGFFYFSKNPNARHYTYEKTIGGLVDMVIYCHSNGAKQDLSRITAWAEKNLSRKRGYAFNAGDGDTEWYTLSENLYRAYLATGETRYRDFAKVWEYNEYWDIYGRKGDIFGKRPNGQTTGGYHAYSHVNTLSGLGAAYLVDGDKRHIQTLSNAYDILQKEQCFATGGFGPNELLAPRDTLLRLLGETHNSFETQCGSWAGFKVCKYLISCTGDARYGDWIEKLIVNGIGASISMSPDGKVCYYSDYCTGGAEKHNMETPWTCCTGTRPMAAADYHDLIYFHAANTLFVNLYTPSSVNVHLPGGKLRLEQHGTFPQESAAHFIVKQSPNNFRLALRIPGWLAGNMQVRINGKSASASPGTDHWLRISSPLTSGDRVDVSLPMAPTITPFMPGKAYPAAITVGPTALATPVKGPLHDTLRNLPAADLLKHLRPVAGHPLTFELLGSNRTTATFRPFYTFAEGEPYLIYLDPAAPDRISYRLVHFSPGWNDSGSFRFTREVGAIAEAEFEGTGVRWLGGKYDDAGIAEVIIDGKQVATVDQFAPGRDLPFEWKTAGLPAAKHKIQIRIINEKNPASKDHFINVAGFEALP